MGDVILTGPKHSGKTTIGRALAALVSGAFVDLDEYIQRHTGKSPRALYREGSGRFTQAEAEALGRLLEAGEGPGLRIIAAGGGLIDNVEALGLLEGAERAGTAQTVYIEVSAGTAWERIAGDAAGLPPFLDGENPRESHRVLHQRRAAAYRQWARFTVAGEGKAPEQIAGEIAALLGTYG
jgi:shikimate kinase